MIVLDQVLRYFILIGLVDCQRIHFCKALEDNGGSISFSLTIPNPTTQRKFVIIKDSYWELEFKAGGDGSGQSKSNGVLALKNNCGTQSDFFVLDGKFFNLGFGTRFGGNDLNEQWNFTVIAVMPKDNLKYYRRELIEIKFDALPENDTENKFGLQSEEVKPDFTNFKPDLAFVSYSNLADHWVVLIQQILSGQNKPKYKLMKEVTRSALKGTPVNKPNPDLPPAVESALGFFKVRGLFGDSLPNTEDDKKNGTIFLIEWCDMSGGDSPPADVRSSSDCKGKIVYVYCATSESDPNPMIQNCAPAIVSTQKLIDCKDQSKWICSDDTGEKPVVTETNSKGPDSDTGKTNEGQNKNKDNVGKEKSSYWFIIVIVAIIVILLIITLTLMFFRNKSKGEPAPETSRSGAGSRAKPGSSSKSSVATSIKSESLSVPSTRSEFQPNDSKTKSKA